MGYPHQGSPGGPSRYQQWHGFKNARHVGGSVPFPQGSPSHPQPYSSDLAAPWSHRTQQYALSANGVDMYRPSAPQPYPPASNQTQWVQAIPTQYVWNDPSYPAASTSHRGRDYLAGLTTSVSNLDLGRDGLVAAPDDSRQRTYSDTNKPLPRLPAPPPPQLPPRPHSENVAHVYPTSPPATHRQSSHPSPAQGSPLARHRPLSTASIEFVAERTSATEGQSSSSPRTRVSSSQTVSNGRSKPNPTKSPHHIPHSQSDPHLKPKPKATPKAKLKAKRSNLRDNSLDDFIVPNSESSAESSDSSITFLNPRLNITDRSPQRRRRATSEQPSRTGISTTSTPKSSTPKPKTSTPRRTDRKSSTPSHSPSGAVKCSGFTRKGTPCQRLVRTEAPYLTMLNQNVGAENKRYCKDHAGMICDVGGFYWRGGDNSEASGTWIDFDEYIPSNLTLQTKALIRTTMESPLTDKESPGFLYAYELRDLNTPTTLYFKVGRTDNVPRRIGEWSSRCKNCTPTLRDIFPLVSTSQPPHIHHPSGTSLNRQPSASISFLPGAFRHTTNPTRQCLAVKRWEKLVHLELADISVASAPGKLEKVREKCEACQAVHREVFPLGRGVGGNEAKGYEDVKEVVCRWERFVKRITESG